MELDRNRWYVRWFFWSLAIWDEFTERNKLYEVRERGTNLCFFIRVTLVWTPLVLLLHAAALGLGVAALTIVPLHAFGGSMYLWGLAAIAIVVALVLGVKRFNKYRREKRREKMNRRYHEELEQQLQASRSRRAAPEPVQPMGPSFGEVLWSWFVAQKKKICPSITFTTELNHEG